MNKLRLILVVASSLFFSGCGNGGGGGGGGGGGSFSENPGSAGSYSVTVSDVVVKKKGSEETITVEGLPLTGSIYHRE